jgi:hypothetical protein
MLAPVVLTLGGNGDAMLTLLKVRVHGNDGAGGIAKKYGQASIINFKRLIALTSSS